MFLKSPESSPLISEMRSIPIDGFLGGLKILYLVLIAMPKVAVTTVVVVKDKIVLNAVRILKDIV